MRIRFCRLDFIYKFKNAIDFNAKRYILQIYRRSYHIRFENNNSRNRKLNKKLQTGKTVYIIYFSELFYSRQLKYIFKLGYYHLKITSSYKF